MTRMSRRRSACSSLTLPTVYHAAIAVRRMLRWGVLSAWFIGLATYGFAGEPSDNEPPVDGSPSSAIAVDEAQGESIGDVETSDDPATDEPATDDPAADEPATDEPATDEPAADEPATDEPLSQESGDDGAGPLSGIAGLGIMELGASSATPLPTSFETLRPIFFFQGQASGLVPDTFRPITISQLDSRLVAGGSASMSVFDKPQLIRAVFVARLVDSALVSTQTTWDVSHGGEIPQRLSLGRIGLALQSTGLATGSATGFRSDSVPIVTEPDGTASVTVQGDTKLSVSWTAAGRESDREIHFDLAVPQAEQARWLIEVPPDMRLQAIDGVGQSLPSPPPEAGTREASRGTSWYSIEAGGLSRVRMRLLKETPGTGEANVVIRQASMQYELAPAAIRFTSRLLVDPPADGMLPAFHVSGGRLITATVSGGTAVWSETATETGRLIRFRQERPGDWASGPISIVLDGEAVWRSDLTEQSLPWVDLRECVPMVIGNQVPTKLLVDSRLSLLRLDLPRSWRYVSPVESDDRWAIYRFAGPLAGPASTVRVEPNDGQLFAESLLRLSATESRLRATWESSIASAGLGPQPIRLSVDPDWTVESVLLPLSGRSVDLPGDFASNRQVVIWPTADELSTGNLIVRVLGSVPFRVDGDSARYPATSFITIAGGRNRVAAVVTPPPGFLWDVESSLATERIMIQALTAAQRAMIVDVPTDSLLLNVAGGRVPALASQRPAAAFNVSSLLTLELNKEAGRGRVLETHWIKCDSASGELDQVRIEFAAGSRPDIEWSVNEKSTPTRRLIRAKRWSPGQPGGGAGASPDQTDATRSPTEPAVGLDADGIADGDAASDPREIWDMELERSGSRGVLLVGRRETSMPDGVGGRLRVELPSVLGASNRVSQVIVPPSLDVVAMGDGVLRVPKIVGSDWSEIEDQRVSSEGTVLRYDSSGTNWIDVAPAEAAAPVTLFWREAVDIVASGRGGDWITATYSTASAARLVIDHDTDLRLTAVTDRQGVAIPYQSSPGRLVISSTRPSDQAVVRSEQAVIRWSRPASSTELWSRWTVPRISASGIALRRDWRLRSAPDTWIPASALSAIGFTAETWRADSSAVSSNPDDAIEPPNGWGVLSIGIDPESRANIWLLDRSVAFGLVAIIGFLIFGVTWAASSRYPVMAGAAFVASAVALPGLPLGWIYWIAAVCAPIAAGGLVGTTLALLEEEKLRTADELSDNRGVRAGAGRGPGRSSGSDVTPTIDAATDNRIRAISSLPKTDRIVCWLGGTVLAAALTGDVAAQMPSPINAGATGTAAPATASGAAATTTVGGAGGRAARPTVLVPTKPDGTLAGDKVYISQSFFNDLFREKSVSAAPPLITSAVYRLRLDGMTEAGMPSAEWEIRYSFANLAERSEIVLPVRSTQVRGVQWLPGGEAKPLRWSADGDSRIRVSLPPATSAAMLLRLATEVEAPEKLLRRVRLDIPTVTAASLVVDTGTAVQRFELSGAIGQTVSQADNGRLTADLGAIGAIDLAITLRQSSRGIPAIAARRYWVHAAAGRFQVECEIDPGEEAVRRGTDLPIVVLGGRQPILTSADWAVQASEMISPQRQLLTFRALRDNPEPIRLLWDIAADESPGNVAVGDAVAGGAADATDGEAAETVVLPDVISAGSAATPDAFIALQAGEGYRLTALQAPAGTESNSADAIDAFVARWKGYRSTAGQVIRSSSPLVRLALRAETPRPWLADERHHLHVRRGEMLLTYQAKITPGNPSVGPLLLKLPSDLEIRELTINGAAVVRSPRVNGGIAEVALPRPTGAEPIAIRLVAHQTHEIGEPFDPPRARISPVRQASGTYTLTRDHGLRVEEVVSSGLPELDAPDLEIAAQLLGGWVPCWTWKIAEAAPSAAGDSAPPADSVRLGGEFRAERMAPRLEVVQQTAVRWSQSRWMTEVVIRAEARGADGESQPLLDDLNIELPTAWSDQLDVEPAEAWSSQPAIDPATKVVRIRPDAAARSDSVVTVRIRGFRIGEGDSLLQVPTVRVLGATTTQSFMSVPTVAGGRPLVWQTLSAIADHLPEGFDRATMTSEPGGGSAIDDELVFRALNPRATIRLQPSRPEVSLPRATVADVQLFPQQDGQWLASVRWDLEPGDAGTVSIQVPDGFIPIAVWNAGRSIPLRTPAPDAGPLPARPSDRPVGVSDGIIEVKLALSQLAQSLVFLGRYPGRPIANESRLPRLLDVEVDKTWLTLYRAGDRESPVAGDSVAFGDGGWETASPPRRLLALGVSVAEVTEASVSGATNRPQEELVDWLRSWDNRIATLRDEALPLLSSDAEAAAPDSNEESNAPSSATVSDSPSDLSPDTPASANEGEGDEKAWNELIGRWEDYLRRIAGVENALTDPDVGASALSSQWQATSVVSMAGAAETVPTIRTRSDAAEVSQAISLLVGLVMMAGCGTLAWMFRATLAKPMAHPAVWLFAVGLASLAVAPTPVAIAICLVAVSAPMLAGRPTSSVAGSSKSFVARSPAR